MTNRFRKMCLEKYCWVIKQLDSWSFQTVHTADDIELAWQNSNWDMIAFDLLIYVQPGYVFIATLEMTRKRTTSRRLVFCQLSDVMSCMQRTTVLPCLLPKHVFKV